MTDANMPQNSIDKKNKKASVDYAFMLCAPLSVAFFTQGFSAVLTVVISVLTCTILFFAGRKLLKTEHVPGDLTVLVIGITTALLLPASIPWWITVLTVAFAICVCVLPFGTSDKAPFAPAVAAFCFATLCWPEKIFDYSQNGNSLGKMLSYGTSIDDNAVAVLEALVGNVPSAIGTGCILALSGSLLFLLVRRPSDTIPVFSFLFAVCLMALVFPRVATGVVISVVMELCSGMIFFCAVFFMSSPNVMPQKLLGKISWGFASGVVCMLIRYASPLEESVGFGILIAWAFSDFFDKLPYTRKEKRRIKETEPYTEIEIITVVPDEILEKIPDISVEEVVSQSETTEQESDENTNLQESESLDDVVSKENTVTETDAPFITGGDGNE